MFAEVEPLIEQIFQGYKTCIFAYGQSGSGKTYTQYGSIMPRALEYIFNKRKDGSDQFSVSVSFYEIYNDRVYDLLADQTTENLVSEAFHATATEGVDDRSERESSRAEHGPNRIGDRRAGPGQGESGQKTYVFHDVERSEFAVACYFHDQPDQRGGRPEGRRATDDS